MKILAKVNIFAGKGGCTCMATPHAFYPEEAKEEEEGFTVIILDGCR